MIDLIHGPGTIEKELPAMVRQFARFGIDMVKDPILVYPTLHYQNGGVSLKPDGATSVPNLYGAGEISGGVHGRNRLMGNSLLEITVYGRRAGRAAGQRAPEVTLGKLSLAHVDAWEKELAQAGIETDIESPILLPDYTRHGR
jgi:succinate dehydrogenase / fumarate reductase flavoprotein subunit